MRTGTSETSVGSGDVRLRVRRAVALVLLLASVVGSHLLDGLHLPQLCVVASGWKARVLALILWPAKPWEPYTPNVTHEPLPKAGSRKDG